MSCGVTRLRCGWNAVGWLLQRPGCLAPRARGQYGGCCAVPRRRVEQRLRQCGEDHGRGQRRGLSLFLPGMQRCPHGMRLANTCRGAQHAPKSTPGVARVLRATRWRVGGAAGVTCSSSAASLACHAARSWGGAVLCRRGTLHQCIAGMTGRGQSPAPEHATRPEGSAAAATTPFGSQDRLHGDGPCFGGPVAPGERTCHQWQALSMGGEEMTPRPPVLHRTA